MVRKIPLDSVPVSLLRDLCPCDTQPPLAAMANHLVVIAMRADTAGNVALSYPNNRARGSFVPDHVYTDGFHVAQVHDVKRTPKARITLYPGYNSHDSHSFTRHFGVFG